MPTIRFPFAVLVPTLLAGLAAGCAAPAPFADQVEVSAVDFTSAGIEHRGTLVLPRSNTGARAAVLLLSATPADRNWDLPSHVVNTGMYLAHALAAAGHPSYRWDRMGSGHTPAPDTLSWDAYVAAARDAAAALVRERTNGGRPAGPLVLLAHGDACLVAAAAAAGLERAGRRVAGLVFLSPPGLPLARAIPLQVRATMLRAGHPPATLATNQAYLERAFAALAADAPLASVASNWRILRWTAAMAVQFHTPRFRAYARSWLGADLPTLRAAVRAPVFLAWGGRDVQYPPEIHRGPWERARRPGDILRVYPLMDYVGKRQPDSLDGKTPAEILYSYGEFGREVDADLVRDLVAWVAALPAR